MAETIPLVDFTGFRDGDADARRRIGKALGHAAENLGFAVIQGHGVDPALGRDLREAALRFFDRPLDEKLEVRRPRNDQNRGYIPYGEETLVRMAGGDSPPDFKEVFAIGPDDVPETAYFTGPGSYPSFAPNLWPEGPADLRPKMLAYWAAMEGLMRMLGQGFALGLDMPEDRFDAELDHRHTSQLRLLHYPALAAPPAPGQLRAGAHTDLGMMTILRNDPTPGGLQVQGRNGEWIDAPAIENTYILNIGDLLMRWSNDRLRSTPHRVAVPPMDAGDGARRLSIGFFVGPRYDAMVECFPTCRTEDNPAKYPPITAHDYRTARFAAGAGDNAPYRDARRSA